VPSDLVRLHHHHSLAANRCFMAAPVLLGLPFTAPLYALNLQGNGRPPSVTQGERRLRAAAPLAAHSGARPVQCTLQHLFLGLPQAGHLNAAGTGFLVPASG